MLIEINIAEMKRSKIDGFLASIEAKLEELDEEKEELKQYQKLDRNRRSIEYTIFERELQDVSRTLEAVISVLFDFFSSSKKGMELRIWE